MNTFETVRDMLVDQFKLDPARITLDATLESLNIDSLSAVEFIFLLEEKFAVGSPEEATAKRTVRDVVEELDHLLAEKQSLVATENTA